MVSTSITKPGMTAKKYFSFLTSNDAAFGIGVVVGTPLGLGLSGYILTNVPFIRGRQGIALLIASVIVFALAGAFSGLVSRFVLGVSIGLALNALFTIPQVAGLVARVSRTGGSTGQESN